MAHLSCWIGLDDSTKENGCVHYVPGSHRWNLLPRADFANDMDAVLEALTPEQRREFEPVPVELKKGECSFHHPLMVHGSYRFNSVDVTSNRSPVRHLVIVRNCLIHHSDLPIGAMVQ